jgi:hypothetical protein
MNTLTSLEKSILIGAGKDGMISFPQGTARAVEQIFRIFDSLAARGYLQYANNKNWYHAYWLTEKGRRVARLLRSEDCQSLSRAA